MKKLLAGAFVMLCMVLHIEFVQSYFWFHVEQQIKSDSAAFPTEQEARAYWTKVALKHPELFR